MSTINISLAWSFRSIFKTTLIRIAGSHSLVFECWQKLSHKWDKTLKPEGWGRLHSVGEGGKWARSKDKGYSKCLTADWDICLCFSFSTLSSEIKIFNNALNVEQNMNQNCFYPSMPHIKTQARKNYACLKTSFKCVITHPIGNLRGNITPHIASQNSNSLTLQGFFEGQIRRKANVSSFGDSMTCSESVSCLFRPRNWSRKSNKMNLLSLENTHYPQSFASLAFWGKASSFFFSVTGSFLNRVWLYGKGIALTTQIPYFASSGAHFYTDIIKCLSTWIFSALVSFDISCLLVDLSWLGP